MVSSRACLIPMRLLERQCRKACHDETGWSFRKVPVRAVVLQRWPSLSNRALNCINPVAWFEAAGIAQSIIDSTDILIVSFLQRVPRLLELSMSLRIGRDSNVYTP